MKAIKRNLKPESDGRVMYCRVCGQSASASSGDYWDVADDYVFHCCGQPMALGRFVTKFVEDKGEKS
jgi:hypothetical protein